MKLNKNYKRICYDDSYFTSKYREKYGIDYASDPEVKRKNQNRLDRLLKYKQSGSLLEIGAALGDFITKTEPYFFSVGIDNSIWACDNSDFKVLNIDFEKQNISSKFDIVCAFFSLEHMDFYKVFNKIVDLLCPDGILFFDVPLFTENEMPEDHFIEFDLPALSKFLKDNKFLILEIQVNKKFTTASIICQKQ
jgi:SAM-dependent methyltransferase